MKIDISYDTKTKELLVTKNGLVATNVEGIDFQADWDDDKKYFLHLKQSVKDENNDVRETLTTNASIEKTADTAMKLAEILMPISKEG